MEECPDTGIGTSGLPSLKRKSILGGTDRELPASEGGREGRSASSTRVGHSEGARSDSTSSRCIHAAVREREL